ncbi:hypothetical protein [Corynebacterium aquatimens]|uniref:Uncharacterized protein n=1 Tax=Corynebacterium aquatimens TaxID=1190508 RepID=A0A931E3E1_9CORY|nr:hypothetical protein [Corynebacterium aquatimens]MBG6121773.1 hypothetical protein [Corynebacterium aquatimens]WJY65688.1 hypothetical protein CAQUA_04875 [Corynebacterium aquatimens]
MTIAVRNPRTANVPAGSIHRAPQPADVWDIPERTQHRRADHVRTLGEFNRNPEPYRDIAEPTRAGIETKIEKQHEARAATLMGTMLGLALIVGAAFSGMFSAEEPAPAAPAAPNVVSASVR